MKLRKLFAWLMTLVMLLGMVPAAHAELAGCNHDWDSGKWLRGEPTYCLDWKPKTYTCSICGATATNEECGPCVPGAKNWVRPQASNCQEHGVWEITCKYCGEWLEGMEEPGPHKWVTNTIEEPACEYPGWKETVCAMCGSEQGGPQEIPPLGHNWGPEKLDVAATCIMPGLKSRMCTRCNTREEWETDYGSHSWGEWRLITQGDCINPGTEARTCSICGQEQSRTASGGAHAFGEWKQTMAPTCTELGKRERVCTRCGASEWGVIAIVDHIFGDWYVVTPAQIGVAGLEQRDCTYGCGTFEQREIPPLDPNGTDTGSSSGLNVYKQLIARPTDENVGFVAGEELSYMITVENKTGADLFNLEISDPLRSGNPVIATYPKLSANQGVTVHFYYIITESDAANGSIVNTAYAAAETAGGLAVNGTSNTVTTPVGTQTVNGGIVGTTVTFDPEGLTVTKSASAGDYSNPCKPGDEVAFTITVTNNTGVELLDVEITDPIKGGNEDAVLDRIASMQPGESVTASFSYTVTEEDATVGIEGFENTAYASGYTADGIQVSGTSNTVKVLCVIPHELSISKTVSGTPANGEFYVPGETICFVISMTNDTPYPLYNVTLTDPLCEDQYFHDEVNGISYLYMDDFDSSSVPQGYSSAQVAPTYVVTEADAEAGFVTNTATVSYQTWYGENKTASASITVKCGKATDDGDIGLSNALSVTKSVTSTPANGSYYVPGETVTYEVCVKNNGEPLNDLDVSDWMWGDEHAWVGSFATGEAVIYPVTHIVTDADARAKHVNNIACATAIDKDGNQITEYSNLVTVPCGFPEGDDPFGMLTGLEITKEVESLPLNGSYYTEGETVAYKITYTNTGEMPLTDVVIYDAMGGMNEIATAETLNPGESRVCWFNYAVTAADVTRGYIANTAIGRYELNGFLNSVSSNTVVVDTDGKPDPDGFDFVWGTFVPNASGTDHCITTLNGWNSNSINTQTVFCPGHAATQETIAIMMATASDTGSRQRVYEYAISLWQTDLEKLYTGLIASADPAARAYLVKEYVQFCAWAGNYQTVLNTIPHDQPEIAAKLTAQVWQDKCIGLCNEAGTAPAQPGDSLFLMAQGADAHETADACGLTCTTEAGAMTCMDVFCADHSFLFGMTSALLTGGNTADGWNRIGQMWKVEIDKAYNTLCAAAGAEYKAAIMIERNVFENWLIAREAELHLLYPENPEIAAELLTREIMTHVADLCVAGQ